MFLYKVKDRFVLCNTHVIDHASFSIINDFEVKLSEVKLG